MRKFIQISTLVVLATSLSAEELIYQQTGGMKNTGHIRVVLSAISMENTPTSIKPVEYITTPSISTVRNKQVNPKLPMRTIDAKRAEEESKPSEVDHSLDETRDSLIAALKQIVDVDAGEEEILQTLDHMENYMDAAVKEAVCQAEDKFPEV